jgi:hypothetical protein
LASTLGGFLIGFGLCLLLVSLGTYVVLSQYYSQIMEWRDEVEQIYEITHSSAYESAINALDFISPGLNAIADAISWIPGISQYAEPLRQISGVSSTMKQIRSASETAYQVIQAVQVAPQLLTYGTILALILIIVGAVLISRAKRPLKATYPP